MQELLKITLRLSESSIDYPQVDLDLSIWDKKDDTYTIKPEIKKKILDTLDAYPLYYSLVDMVKGIHITGSCGTNQYRNDSDVDIHLIISDNAAFYDDEKYLKKVADWFTVNRDKIDGYIGKRPIEVYLQYNANQELMSDGCYDLLTDKWLTGPKLVSLDYDPCEDYTGIAQLLKDTVEDADKLFGEIKRDVIDYDVIKNAAKQLPQEHKQKFLEKLESKLQEIETDIEQLYKERKEWVDMRHNASKPQSPEQALSDVELVRRWKDTNALFKFIDRYRYLKIIKDLKDLLISDDKGMTPSKVDVVKDIVGVK